MCDITVLAACSAGTHKLLQGLMALRRQSALILSHCDRIDVPTLLALPLLDVPVSELEGLSCNVPEVGLGCRSKCSDESAVVACTSTSAGDKRGLLLAAEERKAKDKSVKEDEVETEDRGLLPAD